MTHSTSTPRRADWRRWIAVLALIALRQYVSGVGRMVSGG